VVTAVAAAVMVGVDVEVSHRAAIDAEEMYPCCFLPLAMGTTRLCITPRYRHRYPVVLLPKRVVWIPGRTLISTSAVEEVAVVSVVAARGGEAREESEGSDSGQLEGVKLPGMGDATALGRSSTFTRFADSEIGLCTTMVNWQRGCWRRGVEHDDGRQIQGESVKVQIWIPGGGDVDGSPPGRVSEQRGERKTNSERT
jgi:hypothetical protein